MNLTLVLCKKWNWLQKDMVLVLILELYWFSVLINIKGITVGFRFTGGNLSINNLCFLSDKGWMSMINEEGVFVKQEGSR